jgi:hypothetical protein
MDPTRIGWNSYQNPRRDQTSIAEFGDMNEKNLNQDSRDFHPH